MKPENLKVGQSVYKLEWRRAGNTTLRTAFVSEYVVLEVDPIRCAVRLKAPTCERWYGFRIVKNMRLKRPVLVESAAGLHRPARRGEAT